MTTRSHPVTEVGLVGHGGVRLAADHRGDESGLPVVLLHGGGQTRGSWRRTADRLAEAGCWAWTFDARGHGESDWAPDADYRLACFATDLARVCEQVGRPPLIVGASLGGLAGLLALGDDVSWTEGVTGYRRHDASPGSDASPGTTVPPVDGLGLVLVDSLPELNKAGTTRIQNFMTDRMTEGFADLDEVADAVASYNPHRPRPTDLEGLKRNVRQLDDGRWYWHWDPAFLLRTEGSQPPSEIGDTDLMMGCARAIESAILLIRGQMSDVVELGAAERFLQAVPGSRLVDVSDSGHMVAGDHNDAFTRALLDHVAELGGAR